MLKTEKMETYFKGMRVPTRKEIETDIIRFIALRVAGTKFSPYQEWLHFKKAVRLLFMKNKVLSFRDRWRIIAEAY